MIANKIKPKILKVINKFPTKTTVYRDIENEFGESGQRVKICDITGFYHEGSQVSVSIADKGVIKRDKTRQLMIVVDNETLKIKENDYLFIDDKKYKIIDKNNQSRLDIYFDMFLEVDV